MIAKMLFWQCTLRYLH